MKYDLAALTRRSKTVRRSSIPLRPIIHQRARATDLYRSAYLPMVKLWEAALPDIEMEYKRTISAMVSDSARDIETVITQVELSGAALLINVRIRVEQWARTVEGWHRGKWRSNVLSASGVDLSTLIGPADAQETLEALIERNVGLVRSVSDETRRRIAESVFRGLQNRTSSVIVARQIREAVDIERRRALRIAADQNVKVTSALNDERRRQAGITAWEWIHSDKRNPRPEHDARDGFLYSDDPDIVGQTYEGKRLRKPPEDRPGGPPYCGCTSRAVLIL